MRANRGWFGRLWPHSSSPPSNIGFPARITVQILANYGVDFAGSQGNAIYATDAGVVVYSGWNTWGYGNMVVIDHGNGWQSLYAHMVTPRR